MTAKAPRLSQLSPERQALVRLCQTIDHGSIEDLDVRQSEPVFDPFPVMLKDVKLDVDEGFRPEIALADFEVTHHVNRLCRLLDKMAAGRIRRIEVRGGLPRRILVEIKLQMSPTANADLQE
jgi:hypothetical protein